MKTNLRNKLFSLVLMLVGMSLLAACSLGGNPPAPAPVTYSQNQVATCAKAEVPASVVVEGTDCATVNAWVATMQSALGLTGTLTLTVNPTAVATGTEMVTWTDLPWTAFVKGGHPTMACGTEIWVPKEIANSSVSPMKFGYGYNNPFAIQGSISRDQVTFMDYPTWAALREEYCKGFTMAPPADAFIEWLKENAAAPAEKPAPDADEEAPAPDAPEFELMAPLTGNVQSFLDGLVTITGFDAQSTPARWGNGIIQTDQKCPWSGSEWIFCEPGVLFADDYAEAKANPSATWTGGADADNLFENATGSILVPEDGYLKTTGPAWKAIGGDYGMLLKAAPGVSYLWVDRGMYDGEGDRNVRVSFESPGHEGTVKPMRQLSRTPFNGFYSSDHLLADVKKALGLVQDDQNDGFDNCGSGLTDACDKVIVLATDRNHKTVTIYVFTAAGVDLVYTNAVAPAK